MSTEPCQASVEWVLRFDAGSITLRRAPPDPEMRVQCATSGPVEGFSLLDALGFVWDDRSLCYRALASSYRATVEAFISSKVPFRDEARGFRPVSLPLNSPLVPRAHQQAAFDGWLAGGCRGYVVLPTGAGKTMLAVLCIARLNRPTLVHVPTLDLVEQWKSVLQRFFTEPIGVVGGGSRVFTRLTVTTYDSAIRHVAFRGADFGLLVFDECHHLPGESYRFAAAGSLAPYRLGLTATPERADGGEKDLDALTGLRAYAIGIGDLTGSTLAPYDVHTIRVEFAPEERAAYERHRAVYRSFLREHRIDFRSPSAWQDFLRAAARAPGGREALRAFREQKRLSLCAGSKFGAVWDLLIQHRHERALVFTHDNATAYALGERFHLPVVTHITHQSDRVAFLERFRDGRFNVLVTSRVLNEGVDVPEASVGIVVSGTGTVREHVQRLGRILRAGEGKRAVLYEIVTGGSGEEYTSLRRRNHDAYQRAAQISDPHGQGRTPVAETR